MSNKEQFNVRLPGNTLECIDLLVQTYGMTKTQVIILAVDRLCRDVSGVPQYRPNKDAELVKATNPDD